MHWRPPCAAEHARKLPDHLSVCTVLYQYFLRALKLKYLIEPRDLIYSGVPDFIMGLKRDVEPFAPSYSVLQLRRGDAKRHNVIGHINLNIY